MNYQNLSRVEGEQTAQCGQLLGNSRKRWRKGRWVSRIAEARRSKVSLICLSTNLKFFSRKSSGG